MSRTNPLRQITYPDQWIVNKETPTEALQREMKSLEIIEQLREQEELYSLGRIKQSEQIAENLKPVTELLKSRKFNPLTKEFEDVGLLPSVDQTNIQLTNLIALTDQRLNQIRTNVEATNTGNVNIINAINELKETTEMYGLNADRVYNKMKDVFDSYYYNIELDGNNPIITDDVIQYVIKTGLQDYSLGIPKLNIKQLNFIDDILSNAVNMFDGENYNDVRDQFLKEIGFGLSTLPDNITKQLISLNNRIDNFLTSNPQLASNVPIITTTTTTPMTTTVTTTTTTTPTTTTMTNPTTPPSRTPSKLPSMSRVVPQIPSMQSVVSPKNIEEANKTIKSIVSRPESKKFYTTSFDFVQDDKEEFYENRWGFKADRTNWDSGKLQINIGNSKLKPIPLTQGMSIILTDPPNTIKNAIDQGIVTPKDFQVLTNLFNPLLISSEIQKVHGNAERNTKVVMFKTGVIPSVFQQALEKKYQYDPLIKQRINEDSDDDNFVDAEGGPPDTPFKKTGQGLSKRNITQQKKKQAYKVKNDGSFGSVFINIPQLMGYHKLIVLDKNGNILMNNKVDKSFVELLTKRFNPKIAYTNNTIKYFNKLVQLAGLPIHETSTKYKLLNNNEVQNRIVRIINSPDELVQRLEILVGQKEANNDSKDVTNELSEILDQLVQLGVINKKQHAQLFNRYIR